MPLASHVTSPMLRGCLSWSRENVALLIATVLVQATQLRLKHKEAKEEAKQQQAEARRLAVRNKDLESRSQVPRRRQTLLHNAALGCSQQHHYPMSQGSLHSDAPIVSAT